MRHMCLKWHSRLTVPIIEGRRKTQSRIARTSLRLSGGVFRIRIARPFCERGRLVRTSGLKPTLCMIQEEKLASTKPQRDYAIQNRHLVPQRFDRIQKTLTTGASEEYRGGAPGYRRTSCLPYRQTDEGVSLPTAQKLRKDIAEGHIFVCATEMITAASPIDAAPPITAGGGTQIEQSVPIAESLLT